MQRPLTLALVLLALASPLRVDATAQDPDSIRIEGKVLDLNTNPLGAVIAAKDWRAPTEAVIWSSNWRGYTAEWEVRDGRLFLMEATFEEFRQTEEYQKADDEAKNGESSLNEEQRARLLKSNLAEGYLSR